MSAVKIRVYLINRNCSAADATEGCQQPCVDVVLDNFGLYQASFADKCSPCPDAKVQHIC